MFARANLLLICTVFASCQDQGGPPPSDNLLSLQLGGDYGSLTEDLRRDAPQSTEPAEAEAEAKAEAEAEATAEPRPSATPQEPPKESPRQPAPKTRSEPAYQTVRLAAGQTLYNLCQTNLGTGQRWREVARLNGWTERQAGRLEAGQAVKLPLR